MSEHAVYPVVEQHTNTYCAECHAPAINVRGTWTHAALISKGEYYALATLAEVARKLTTEDVSEHLDWETVMRTALTLALFELADVRGA